MIPCPVRWYRAWVFEVQAVTTFCFGVVEFGIFGDLVGVLEVLGFYGSFRVFVRAFRIGGLEF